MPFAARRDIAEPETQASRAAPSGRKIVGDLILITESVVLGDLE